MLQNRKYWYSRICLRINLVSKNIAETSNVVASLRLQKNIQIKRHRCNGLKKKKIESVCCIRARPPTSYCIVRVFSYLMSLYNDYAVRHQQVYSRLRVHDVKTFHD